MEAQESKLMNDFQVRARPLVGQLHQILESAEVGLEQAPSLLEYARIIEMIQTSGRTLGQVTKDPYHLIHKILDYSSICKSIGLKIADIRNNEMLFEVTVALLTDATEVLGILIESLKPGSKAPNNLLNQKLVERLKWASYQFQSQGRAKLTEGEMKLEQTDVDLLLKKMGIF